MSLPPTILDVVFYRTDAGSVPVREWLKSLKKDDRRIIGTDIKTVQYGWPLGMPLVRKIEPGLWEARILFTVVEDKMVLLHGFIKKSQKLPLTELATAKHRLGKLDIVQLTDEKEKDEEA
jgi:phage-related protein